MIVLSYIHIYSQSLRSKFRKHHNTSIALFEKLVTHIVSRNIRLFGQFEQNKNGKFVFLNGM
jgi:predicted ferric reductase